MRHVLFFSLLLSFSSLSFVLQSKENLISLEETITRTRAVEETLEQTEVLESILDELLAMANKRSITLHDLSKFRSSVKDLKQYSADQKTTLRNKRTALDAYQLSIYNKQVIAAIGKAFAGNIQNLSTINSVIVGSTILDTYSPEDLNNCISENAFALENLSKATSVVGLTWYNKAYRQGENLNTVYKLWPTFKNLAALTICAGIVYAMYTSAKNTLSPTEDNVTEESNTLSTLNTSTLFKQFNNGKYSLLGLLPISFAPEVNLWSLFLEKFSTNAKDKTLALWDDKWTSLQNWLRGRRNATHTINDSIVIEDFDESLLIGLEEQMVLMDQVIHYICDAERFERSNTSIGKGYLFSGPPRTGKTFLAQWLAYMINTKLKKFGKKTRCGFKCIQAAQLYELNGIKKIMEEAEQEGLCVVFIDEIDTYGLQRDRSSNILQELLTTLGNLNSNTKVIFIAATNKPEHLDVAVRSPGRFEIVPFLLPDYQKRLVIFNTFFNRLALDLNNINTESLARQTAGSSQGEIVYAIKHAQFIAKINEEPLSQKHFEQAINSKIRHILSNENHLTPNELNAISIFRAGQALAHTFYHTAETIELVTVNPILRKIQETNVWIKNTPAKKKTAIKFGGMFTYLENESLVSRTKETLSSKAKVYLAGHIAQEVMLGAADLNYCSTYTKKAFDCALEEELNGFDSTAFSSKELQELKQKARTRVLKYKEELHQLFTTHMQILTLVTDTLCQEHALSGSAIKEIFLTNL